MEVNDEINSLKELLTNTLEILKPGEIGSDFLIQLKITSKKFYEVWPF